MIRQIAIIGLGLIGGSLALAIKKHNNHVVIRGYDFPEVLSKARERNAIDRACSSVQEAVESADLVILAVPIGKILFFLSEIAPFLKKGAIVTDVGSVKTPVMHQAKKILREDVFFIGGHPMAGSEKSGIQHADAFLFENATYAICPPLTQEQSHFLASHQTFIQLLETVGARIIVLDAEKHDRIAATVSHLPQLLATTLMNYVGHFHENDATYLRLAAGGFRDMTRIASSRFSTWKDIFEANKEPIMSVLDGFIENIQSVKELFAGSKLQQLDEAFSQASTFRNLIPKNSKGFLHPLADVYVYAEDKPGFLFHLTRVLHQSNINIKDLELLKIREGIEGVFRISFESQSVAQSAIASLQEANYEAFQL